MTVKDIVLVGTAFLCLIFTNLIAFIYDGGWIDVAISLNSLYFGAILVYYLKAGNSKTSS